MNNHCVISFALWGSDPKYLKGFRANIALARRYYPGWGIVLYYYDVPKDYINSVQLPLLGCYDFSGTTNTNGCYGLYLRFTPASCNTIDRFVVRDADSRINAREADAVQEWIESGKGFHCMRDHRAHRKPIMGGMWGMTKGCVPNFGDMMFDWVVKCKHKKHKRGRYFKTDQRFLAEKIWPLVKDKALVHDDAKRITGKESEFRVELPDGQFVGQQFDENDKPILV